MTAIQRVSRLAMVEFVQTDVPADRDKFLAVMLGMAFDALILAAALSQQRWMQSTIRRQPLPDFPMAGETAELALAASCDVATRAMRGPFQRRVSF